MDSGIEDAVHFAKGGNKNAQKHPLEIVAAEEFRDEESPSATPFRHIANHPVVRRQNTCFLAALVLFVFVFAIYVVSDVYLGEDDALRGDDGTPATKHISDAAGTMQHTKGKGKDYLHKSKEIAAWHNKTITVADGVQYKVLQRLVHDKTAFTEGLTFVNGRLFESVGLYRQSNVRELDPKTGEVINAWPMAQQYFAEGLTYVDGKLLQLTYKKKTGFIYDLDNMDAPPQSFKFDTITKEGWGFTYDAKNHELIVSDGSEYLLFWDPDTFTEKRRVQVHRQGNQNAKNINELEFWRDRVIANVWFQDTILVINPVTGVVEKEYDFHQLYPQQQRRQDRADVLNGISISDDPDILYVTGKNWDRMFKVKLL